MKYMNLPDLAIIFASAYLVVWAANGLLRHAGGSNFHA
jgi:hypothetical protein